MKGVLHSIQTQGLLLKTAYQREGFWYVIRKGFAYVARWPFDVLVSLYHKYLNRHKSTFTFQGQTYNYYYHSYNTTWKNERGIEIPIIQRLMQENSGIRILEIGNVLRHYFLGSHDVVDLAERYPGVINQDIADFCPGNKYDLIVSISTFEHIGCWDKGPRQPEKLLQAIRNVLENILAPGGKFVITAPLGQNPDMERYMADGTIKFDSLYCMKQVDAKLNCWNEFYWPDIRAREFDAQGEWCGKEKAFLIGITQKPQE